MARVTGLKAHIGRLDALTNNQAVKAINAGLSVAGNLIEVEAELSITRGSVSGKNHVPSAPGQAPNNDTGVLKNNIETVVTGPLSVEIQSKAPYAVPLELGTSKMAARPYMKPAAKKMRPEVAATVRDVVNEVIRRKGG